MAVKQYKILLTGGGTGGSVTPILAIVEELKVASAPGEYNFLWLGTKAGIEKALVEKAGIAFKDIPAGKLRRYFSWQNFFDPFVSIAGFLKAFKIIRAWRPDLIISAGGFVGVPVGLAGRLLRVPLIIHQQDARPTLSNIILAPLARTITVTLEKSLADFGRKAVWTGNPVRRNFQFNILNSDKKELIRKFGFDAKLPTVLIMGGGTGARAINRLVEDSQSELAGFSNVILVTGQGKRIELSSQSANIRCFEFLDADAMTEAYAVADAVVCRAGMATLTELATLGKPTIIIPIPGSHQEDNAQIFHEAKAALVLAQGDLDEAMFKKILGQFLADKVLWQELSDKIKTVIKTDASQKIVAIISKILSD